ncbi:MAG: CoA transferase subunit A [Myxococcales bacterium]|nr:CoA transferase subunit A [Myxococcales bacterium]USN51383.1 MAG: CoA transferase subunit A [Myxococcales bacterium]
MNALYKVVDNAHVALRDLFDGATIMSGGFGLSGGAENCIEAIRDSGKKNLTIISNNCGNQGQGLAVLLKNHQIKKVICSFVGGNPDLEELVLNNAIDIELNPQGTLAERIRAGGVGIGGFFTPTGVGTVVAKDKEHRTLNNKNMIFETALTADFSILRAHVADTYGNLRFYRTSQNFCPAMAMAGKITIVEAEKIVDFGVLDPDDIHLPGIFVQRIFLGQHHKNVIEHKKVRSTNIL